MAMQPHDRAKAKHKFKTMGRNLPTPSHVVERAKKKEAWALELKRMFELDDDDAALGFDVVGNATYHL